MTDFQAQQDRIDRMRADLDMLQADLDRLRAEEAAPDAIVPVSVLVHWSESNHFPGEEKEYSFSDFEAKARSAARDQGKGKGYAKTKVTLTLSNGDTIQLRVDLAEDDDHGAADVVRSYQLMLEKEPWKLSDTTCMGHGFYKAINSIAL